MAPLFFHVFMVSFHLMDFYALQVRTRSEDRYIKKVINNNTNFRDDRIRLHFPRRRMQIWRKGMKIMEVAPVFPGYIFLETADFSNELRWFLRQTEGFFRFLPDNTNPIPLAGRDLSTLIHFISTGPIAEQSRVIFDEHDRIQIVSGPLKGLEGQIVKVDKRKGRAKVKLDLYSEQFLIDFSFELIARP